MKKLIFIFVFCFAVLMTFAQTATQTIIIQPKQTLYAIARQYNISATELKSLNVEYAPNFTLTIGDKFKIPANAKEVMTWQESLNPNAVPTKKTTISTPVGTVVNTPADTATVEKTKAVNVSVPVAVRETAPPINKPTISTHVVKKGETLLSVARKYGMSLSGIAQLNKLTTKTNIKIGQKLKVRTLTNSQETPVIYKPINPPTVVTATTTNNVEKIANSPANTVPPTEISAPAKPVAEEVAQPPIETTTEKEDLAGSGDIQQDALFINANELPSVPKTVNAEIPAAKENVPNDNAVVKKEAPIAEEKKAEQPKIAEKKKEEPKIEKPKFVETPKDPNAPAPIKAKDLAEKVNQTSVKTPLIEPTEDLSSKQFEASFNRTINPNSKRTLRGIATVVKNPELTSSSFVLYNYADEGDIVKVVNLMSKKVMYLKVVGKMNANNEDAVLQVSSDTAKLLQAGENRFLIEVTGY